MPRMIGQTRSKCLTEISSQVLRYIWYFFNSLSWFIFSYNSRVFFLLALGGHTVTFVDPKIRAVSAPPGPISEQTTVTPGALPVTMSNTNSNGAPQNGAPGGNDKKAPPKLQKQKSFTVTTVYTPPSNPSKAMQKIRAKTRAAKAFKSTLSVRKDFLLKNTIMLF